ncbi:TRAP transporter substrate-binding protein [Arenibacter certesii]|uniref:C4-dicarboxylate ABC transporter substrate-binding protein n=1 Tax=Arenibacter certesii TaxID=228955 RepID=A0A918IXN1_9FLAO|nr:TRAP transporter substrate-binding protein [Arenibacter certesii]GGW37645.1 C4-dicarboxylate ABC transporter substrate-binding protein [Arenibacter certesii]
MWEFKIVKLKLCGLIGAVVCLFIMSCSENTSHKTLLFAHSLPITHPVHKGILSMQEILNEKSGGKLQIKIFPDGQLGSEREMLELLQIGSVAMTKVSAASMSSFAPEYKVLGIPYLFRDSKHMFGVLEGEVGKKILEGGSEYLLRGLCFYDAGARSFYTLDGFIKTPEDLKGKKIRVMNDQMAVNMVNDLGGSATPMAYGELYTALQQRVVDGAENNVPSFVTSNHYEICKFYTVDEHTMTPDVVVVGTKFWDTLNEEEKEWLQAAADESVAKQKVFWSETVKENMEVLKKANVKIYNPDKSPFIAKTKPIMEALLKDPTMKKIIDQINDY